MSLIDANLFPEAATMIHNGKEFSEKEKIQKKSMFLEGLIRFLDIYANNEIGGEYEIDIMKVALFVNSARFENEDLYYLNDIYDVFGLLEQLAILELPIWRFLRLSDYQFNLFEKGYDETLISRKLAVAAQKPCYGCIWFESLDTPFGTLDRCRKPRVTISFERDTGLDVDSIKKCEWLTTLTTIPKAINRKNIPNIRKHQFLDAIPKARENFQEHLKEDTFFIPKELTDVEKISLSDSSDAMSDLLLAFSNKRTISERQFELRIAMMIEGMIRFFEIFAKMEMGNNYVADISNISKYILSLEKSELSFIQNLDDVYEFLENKIIEENFVKQFVKFEE